MSVVLSLLRAIDRANGEALVMHVGEKPYVVTAAGHAELAAKALTIPAMTGMLDQLLPPETRQALDELGAVEYHLPPQPGSAPGACYSVVAARGGDDIWIEVRRRKAEPEPEPEVHHVPEAQQVQEVRTVPEVVAPVVPQVPSVQQVHGVHELHPAPAGIAVALAEPETYTLETSGPLALDELPTGVIEVVPDLVGHEPTPEAEPIVAASPEPADEQDPVSVLEPESIAIEEPRVAGIHDLDLAPDDESFLITSDEPHEITFDEPYTIPFEEPLVDTVEEPAVGTIDDPAVVTSDEPRVITFEETASVEVEEPVVAFDEPVAPEPQLLAAEESVASAEEDEPFVISSDEAVPVGDMVASAEPEEQEPEPELAPVHVAPVALTPAATAARLSPAASAPLPQVANGDGLPHLLQVAAAQGASVLYVAVQAKPSLRVDGEIRVLEHETPLTEALLEEGLKAILPTGVNLAAGEVQTCDVTGVGRVQCLSFRDHRGLGAMFRMLPARAISSEQMGLGAPIQALCTETEGLILVAGARGAGKSTLVAALVDQMNRTRRDHVITIEQQIQFVHENRQSFVSQREAREDDELAEAVRSALREGPDVLVVDQVASAEAATFALHAAASGHLVIASITAPTTAGAVARFMEFFGEDRAQPRLTLSEHLRGVITQNLLRKTGGGRAAAREVLVNVPSVAALIANEKFDELASVLNGGRRVGMVPLNDALLALVQSGALDVREAYRKSPDQQELVGQLNRAGLDTTFTEKSA